LWPGRRVDAAQLDQAKKAVSWWICCGSSTGLGRSPYLVVGLSKKSA
jgi:hypothetical protein